MDQRKYSTNRPAEILSFMDEYRREHGNAPTMQEIADGVGLNRSTVYQHLKNMEKSGLIVSQGGTRGYLTRAPLVEVPDSEIVPIVGRIACGSPILAQEDIEGYIRLPVSSLGSGSYFLLRARGDSMIEAGIDSGDLVLIRQQSTADPGRIVVALVNEDAEATLKRYYPEPENRRIRLHPENESMQDIYVDYCTIQGVAVKVIKDLE